MPYKLQTKKGFTLTELIVAIVVSGIAMAMIGMLITSIYSNWKRSEAEAERLREQSIIIGCFDKVVNDVNKDETLGITINFNNDFSIINNNNNENIILSYSDNKLKYNETDYSFNKVVNINIDEVVNINIDEVGSSKRIIKVIITFDNETVYENTYCFIKNYNKEEGSIWQKK